MKKEDYLFRGGYLKKGYNWAVDGDKVRMKSTADSNWVYGYIYFDINDGCFLIQPNDEDDVQYHLWEVAEWQLIRKELFILTYPNTGYEDKWCISPNSDEGFIDEDVIQYLGISEEQFYQIARKNNASCFHHIFEYPDQDSRDVYDTYFTNKNDAENFRNDLMEVING